MKRLLPAALLLALLPLAPLAAREEIPAETIPLARLGAASDVAGACVFLASDAASYTTGTCKNPSAASCSCSDTYCNVYSKHGYTSTSTCCKHDSITCNTCTNYRPKPSSKKNGSTAWSTNSYNIG